MVSSNVPAKDMGGLLKRTPFATKPPPRRESTQWVGDALPGQRGEWPASLRVADGKARLTITLPKQRPCRSETYRRLVAAMPCAHCQRPSRSNACHSEMGKGAGIKSDDRTCWPGCVDEPGRVGCHALIGARGIFTREQRRTLEAKYAAQTRAAIVADGSWPANLPRWVDEEATA